MLLDLAAYVPHTSNGNLDFRTTGSSCSEQEPIQRRFDFSGVRVTGSCYLRGIGSCSKYLVSQLVITPIRSSHWSKVHRQGVACFKTFLVRLQKGYSSRSSDVNFIRRVHNRLLRSRFPAHFFPLIPPSRPFSFGNPDPTHFPKTFLR